jgi:hypothetical protein
MRGVKAGDLVLRARNRSDATVDSWSVRPSDETRLMDGSGLTGAKAADTRKNQQPVTFSETQARKSRLISQCEPRGS